MTSTATSFFFFNDTATTEIYTLSLHDALPICPRVCLLADLLPEQLGVVPDHGERDDHRHDHEAHDRVVEHRERSEEHTSELQSRQYLVCRLLLEKKKN